MRIVLPLPDELLHTAGAGGAGTAVIDIDVELGPIFMIFRVMPPTLSTQLLSKTRKQISVARVKFKMVEIFCAESAGFVTLKCGKVMLRFVCVPMEPNVP